MKPLKKEHVIIVACVFIFLFVVFILAPTFRSLISLKPPYNRSFIDLLKIKREIALLGELREEIEAKKLKREDYRMRCSGPDEIESTLQVLADIAKESAVNISAIKPQAEEDLEKIYGVIGVYSISIKAVGGYHQLGLFINRLENSNKLFSVENVSINGSRSNRYQHDSNILVYTYIMEGDSG